MVAVLTAENKRPATVPAQQRATSIRACARRAEARHGRRRRHAQRMARQRRAAAAGSRRQAAEACRASRHLIAVASGKGGVGKSTVAVNLALGLQAIGLKAGILDADIYGPSQPRLLGITGKPEAIEGKKLDADGGLRPQGHVDGLHGRRGHAHRLARADGRQAPQPDAARSRLGRGDLDVLVIDMPPGTGDVQLTIAQQVPLSGAVIVSTPQDLALIDARKGLAMFRKVNVPVLGIVENMSYFICPECGERSDIFGHGGAKAEAEKLGVPFLGEVPLHMDVRATSDSGQAVTATQPDSPQAQIFREIAERAWAELEAAQGKGMKPPRARGRRTAAKRCASTFASGPTYELPAELLRVMSPSAEVQGHSKEQRVTVGGKRNVKIRELRPVGNYAVRIVFDDGHDTGLFTWSYLHARPQKDKRWGEYLAELGRRASAAANGSPVYYAVL